MPLLSSLLLVAVAAGREHDRSAGKEPPVIHSSTRPGRRAGVARHDPTVITARGTVDAGTVGLLSTEIAKHGAAPVVIDLALVTFLASAGVQLLHDPIARHDVRLHAPPGTPAHQVLNLVGLDDLLTTQ